MTRVAAVDCGTNTIKLLVADLDPESGEAQELVRESRMVRLGQGVDSTGRLADEALARVFAAVEEFAALVEPHAVERTRFCATSAARDAENADVFRTGVEARLGVVPEVVSGSEEAVLSFSGAVRPLAAAGGGEVPGPVLVVDIGGGSTELVLGEGDRRDAVSMDIGSVRLHERHLHSDPPTPAEVAACVADIDRHLDDSGIAMDRAATVVGTSGTIKTLACGVMDLDTYDRNAFDRAVLSNAETARFVDALVTMSVAERRALPYMHPGRADVIGAGALIWSRILARVPVPEHLVSEADILHGMAAAITR